MFTEYSLRAAIKDLQLDEFVYIARKDADDFERALRLKDIPYVRRPAHPDLEEQFTEQYVRFDLEV